MSALELREAALGAAEAELRRHGAERVRLVDVAKALGVSHAALYRHFADKAALIDAISARWLERIDQELATIAAARRPAAARIADWFVTLHRLKRAKVKADPEIYRSFNAAAEHARPVVIRHLTSMRAQLEALVGAAMDEGAIARGKPAAIAAMLFEATLKYHHPRLVLENGAIDGTAPLKRLLGVLLSGLR